MENKIAEKEKELSDCHCESTKKMNEMQMLNTQLQIEKDSRIESLLTTTSMLQLEIDEERSNLERQLQNEKVRFIFRL